MQDAPLAFGEAEPTRARMVIAVTRAGDHAGRSSRRDAMVETAVGAYGFRGIKVHAHDAPITREILDAARRFRIPVLYDVVGKPQILDLIAPEYPDVDIIVPHLGSFSDDWAAHQHVLDQMVRLPNLVTDTAGVRRFDYLVQAVRRVGPHRIVYGSDGPWLHPGLELHRIRLLGLGPSDTALICGGNILRLLARRREPARRFGWVRPPLRASRGAARPVSLLRR